jgi:hypothetical protein
MVTSHIHQKRQAIAALAAILALALLMIVGLFLATGASATSSAKGRPADGPLAKVASWVEPPQRKFVATRIRKIGFDYIEVEGEGFAFPLFGPDDFPIDKSPER